MGRLFSTLTVRVWPTADCHDSRIATFAESSTPEIFLETPLSRQLDLDDLDDAL
jgi:hypothetical protein